MNDRRAFLQGLAGGMAAAVLPLAEWRDHRPDDLALVLHRHRRSAPEDEAYWQLVKDQFPLRPRFILMNAANLCPSPYPVIDAVVSFTRDVDTDASFQNRAKFATLQEESRSLLAAFLGADDDEIAIVRNTSEGNNTVINGLTLHRGDEVLIWDQNHPTNNVAWDVRAARYGYTVTRVSTPPAPASDDELLDAFAEAITERTKVLSFSHVSNVTGVALPARNLCAFAAARGILTLIDGAQTFGAHQVNLHDIGCDFYTGSAHKWFMGPKEAGVLYVRRDRAGAVWPSNVGVGWARAVEGGARKFDNLGQRDDAAVAAVGSAVRFHTSIGAARVERRVRELASYLKERLAERISDVQFTTPLDTQLSGGVVALSVPGVDGPMAFERLYREYDIGCAPRGNGLRFCPHVYNTLAEVDRVVDVVAGLRG